MRRIALAAIATLICIGARAETVTLGPGDGQPGRVEITAHRVEITTHEASVSSSSLTKTFVGAIDRTASGAICYTKNWLHVGSYDYTIHEVITVALTP